MKETEADAVKIEGGEEILESVNRILSAGIPAVSYTHLVLKRIVNEEIVSRFDHALVLRGSGSGAELRRVLAERFGNILTVDYQPTCENMLMSMNSVVLAKTNNAIAATNPITAK